MLLLSYQQRILRPALLLSRTNPPPFPTRPPLTHLLSSLSPTSHILPLSLFFFLNTSPPLLSLFYLPLSLFITPNCYLLSTALVFP